MNRKPVVSPLYMLLTSRTFIVVLLGMFLSFGYILLSIQSPQFEEYMNQYFVIVWAGLSPMLVKYFREDTKAIEILDSIEKDIPEIIKLVTEDNELSKDDLVKVLEYYKEKYGKPFVGELFEALLEGVNKGKGA